MLTLPHIRKQGLSTQEWHRHLGPLMLNTHSPLLKHTHRKPLTERPTDGRTSCSGGKKAFLCFEKHHHYITLLHKSHRLCWPLQSAEGGAQMWNLYSSRSTRSCSWIQWLVTHVQHVRLNCFLFDSCCFYYLITLTLNSVIPFPFLKKIKAEV